MYRIPSGDKTQNTLQLQKNDFSDMRLRKKYLGGKVNFRISLLPVVPAWSFLRMIILFQDKEEFSAFYEYYLLDKAFFRFVEFLELTIRCKNKWPFICTCHETCLMQVLFFFLRARLPMSLGLNISQLWEDEGVQEAFALSHKYQLNETAK